MRATATGHIVKKLDDAESAERKELDVRVFKIEGDLDMPHGRPGTFNVIKRKLRLTLRRKKKPASDSRWMNTYDGCKSLLKDRHMMMFRNDMAIKLSNATPDTKSSPL